MKRPGLAAAAALMCSAMICASAHAGLTVQSIERLSFGQVLWEPEGNPDPARPFVQMAVNIFSMPNHDAPVILSTIETLARTFGPGNFKAQVIPNTFTAGENSQIVLGSAGTFVRARLTGSRDIATLVSRLRPDPNRGEGSLFLTLRSSGISSIEQMKGKRAAMLGPRAFTGRTTAMGELLRRGYDPDRFFSEELYTDDSMLREIELLRKGAVDVAVVRTCFFEEMQKRGPTDDLVAVGVRNPASGSCLTSTDLYPNWTVFVTPLATPEIAKAATGALLAMPADDEGRSWSVASDFTRTDALYRNLRTGPYAYLRSFSMLRFWEEYRDWILIAVVLVLGLIAHSIRTSVLVERRTAELRQANQEQRNADERARKATARMEALQKMGLVGQMSTIFAHELRQPLSAITAYASGLLRMLDRPGQIDREMVESGLEQIKSQAVSADGIVQKVRSYARRSDAARTTLDLRDVVHNACQTVTAAKSWSSTLRLLDSGGRAPVFGDRLELELMVMNLVKNALEAASEGDGRGLVEVSVSAEGARIALRVENSGPIIGERDFARLSEPLSTSKPDGTGLGVAIVRMVAEKHGGSVAFDRRSQGGLSARVTLPAAANEESANA